MRRLLFTEAMRGLLLYNPEARGGKDSGAQALEALTGCGVDVLAAVNGTAEQARAAISAHRQHLDLLVVAGGDGTVNHLLEAAVSHHLPLGLLPLGTANDLARTLSIPTQLEKACRVIAGGRTRAVDLGLANGRYFANAAGIGLQPEVARHVSPTSKRWVGPLAYIPAALAAYRQSRPFRARIAVAGEEPRTLRCIQLTVANGRYFGGGLTIAEDAAIDSSVLHLLQVGPLSPLELLGLARELRRGTPRRAEGTWVTSAAAVDVDTDRRLAVALDGEIASETPVHFEIAREALQVFVPAHAEERTGGFSATG